MIRALIASIATSLMPFAASAVEEPPHTVVLDEGRYQVRAYDPMIEARIEVAAPQDDAPNAGFRPLAGYIFGDNTAREKIEMTAPVTQTASQTIDMTAPVTQTAAGDPGRWTIAFIMPAEWTMETLPVPDNEAVTLTEIPARMVAAVRFSGWTNARAQARREADLRAWIDEKGYIPAGPATYAYYNAPWVPGPFRRNEVMIPVRPAGEAG